MFVYVFFPCLFCFVFDVSFQEGQNCLPFRILQAKKMGFFWGGAFPYSFYREPPTPPPTPPTTGFHILSKFVVKSCLLCLKQRALQISHIQTKRDHCHNSLETDASVLTADKQINEIKKRELK